MRERPSSRLLIVDRESRLLLFKFEHQQGPLAGRRFWATPGGGLDPGESYEEAACREMLEETGLCIDSPGSQVAQRSSIFQLPDGETVRADERFFLIRVGEANISADRWTELERQVVTDRRWWSIAELCATSEQVWPEDLVEIIRSAGV